VRSIKEKKLLIGKKILGTW